MRSGALSREWRRKFGGVWVCLRPSSGPAAWGQHRHRLRRIVADIVHIGRGHAHSERFRGARPCEHAPVVVRALCTWCGVPPLDSGLLVRARMRRESGIDQLPLTSSCAPVQSRLCVFPPSPPLDSLARTSCEEAVCRPTTCGGNAAIVHRFQRTATWVRVACRCAKRARLVPCPYGPWWCWWPSAAGHPLVSRTWAVAPPRPLRPIASPFASALHSCGVYWPYALGTTARP